MDYDVIHMQVILKLPCTCINITAMGTLSANCSDGDIRLVDGVTDYEGRVEICINRVWGTVCSTTSRYYYSRWDVSDAKVVCRQLGHQELGMAPSPIKIKHNLLSTTMN